MISVSYGRKETEKEVIQGNTGGVEGIERKTFSKEVGMELERETKKTRRTRKERGREKWI